MKSNLARIISTFFAGLVLLAGVHVQAVNVTKLDTTSMAASSANWSATPATTDIGEFNGTPTSGTMSALTLGGADLTLGGLQFDNTMTGPATLLSGNTLNLGAPGIDMSAANQNVAINCTVATVNGLVNNWNVNSGRTLTIGSAISTGASSGTAKLNLNPASTGTINLNGYSENWGSDASYLIMTGGTISLGAVNMARTASFGTTAPSAASPIAAASGSGFVVNGATVTATTLSIGVGSRANSSASLLVSSGSLTASGAVVIGKNTGSSRWNPCQVSGGTFTASDTTTGIQLSPQNNSTTPNFAELYVSGGTAIVGKITYGASGDTAAGSGWTIVKGGSLYVGSGGIALVAGGSYSANISLYSGLLGASADWSSSLPIALSGPAATPFTIQAADASLVSHNITLSGAISGVGSMTKTGGGTLTLSGLNTYTGNTTINAGTINAGSAESANLSGPFGRQLANAAGTILFGGGTLQYSGANQNDYSGRFSTAGSQPISIDTAGQNVSFGTAIQGSGTSLTLANSSGNGSLTLAVAGNTYDGATTINGGTLKVSGTITGTGAVAVSSGGTLGGVGSLAGVVTVNSGGHLAPGSSVGALTVGSLTLNSGSVNNFEFNSTPANDQTIVSTSGGLVINGGSFNLYQEGGTTAWIVPGTYNLIQYSGSISGSATSGGNLDSTWTTVSGSNPHIANPQAGYLYSFAVSGGWVTVTLASSVNNGTWGVDNDGNWSVAGNWTAVAGTMPPGSPSDTATLGTGSALRTVTLDANESLGTLNFNNGFSFVVANGGKTLTLDNSGSGAAVNVTGGTANSIVPAVSLNDSATVVVGSGKSLSVSSIISSTTSSKTLTVNGAGTLALSGNNTYGPASGTTGTTLSGGGTLQLGNNNALSTGDLNVAGSSTIQAGPTLNLANMIGVGSGVTANVDANGNAVTLGGIISGNGAISKTGAGTLTLSGANTYSGGTVINSGVLSVSSDGAAGGSAGNLGVVPASATVNNVVLNGGDLLAGSTLALHANRGIGIGASSGGTGGTALIDAASGQTLIVDGVIASAGNTGANNLTVNSGAGNNGTVILGAANTFNGQTVISNGSLQLAVSTALQNSTLNYSNQGGTLSFGSLTSATIGNLSGSQNLALLNGSSAAVALTVGGNNSSASYSGSLSGTGGSLTKNGGGTLTLTGNNFYAGNTAANAGTLEITNNGVINGGAISGQGYLVDGGSLTASSATFNPVNNAFSENNASSVVSLGAVGEVNNAGDGLLISITAGSFTATSISLQRTAAFQTAPTVSAPIAAATGSGFYVNGASANVSLGTLTVGTANSSASTRVDNGTVTASGKILIGNVTGGRWNILQINGGSFTSSDAANGIVINQNNAGGVNSELYLSGGVTTAERIAFGTGSDTANNTGFLIINNGASLYLGSGGIAFGHVGDTANIGLTNGVLGAKADWSSSLAMQLNGNSFTFQAADSGGTAHNITLSGVLSGVGALNKIGGGTLTLGGNNSYAGTAIVNAGGLVVNGNDSSAVGAVTVTNATLGGIGTIGGATTLQSGAQLAPGAGGIGTLTFNNNLTLDVASTNNFAVTSVGGASNKVAVAGLLTPNGSVINITSGSALLPGTNTLFTYASISGTFNATPVFDFAPVHPAAIVDDGAGHINLVVPNQAPVAAVATVVRAAGSPLKVALSGLVANWSDPDGDNVQMTGVNLVTTNGANLTLLNVTTNLDGSLVTNGLGFIGYANTANVNDQLSYSIRDSFGATSIGYVNIVVTNSVLGTNLISSITGGNPKTVTAYGIPGYNYVLERATNLVPAVWVDISTNTAATNGVIHATDNFSDLGGPPAAAYYRLKWQQ